MIGKMTSLAFLFCGALFLLPATGSGLTADSQAPLIMQPMAETVVKFDSMGLKRDLIERTASSNSGNPPSDNTSVSRHPVGIRVLLLED